MADVSKILQSEPMNTDTTGLNAYDKKKQKKKKRRQQAKKHFEELTKIVDETHKELEEKKSPFRICVYLEQDDLFIDIVTIDDSGKIEKVFKHDISDAELKSIVQHIKSGRGLMLDASA